MEATDKIAGDMGDTARRHGSKILYLLVKKLTGSRQSRRVPVDDRNDFSIKDEQREKEECAEHFERC